jgi:hypothetical protein
MGNAIHWIIFWGLAISSIALITYSLVGNFRSIVIAIPLAGILFFTVYVIVMTQQIPGPRLLTVFWLVGSLLGLVRQCFSNNSKTHRERTG